jgi:hypothetical protein
MEKLHSQHSTKRIGGGKDSDTADKLIEKIAGDDSSFETESSEEDDDHKHNIFEIMNEKEELSRKQSMMIK